MKKVKTIEKTCDACPEQYSGTLETGEEIYIRFRWGCGRLDVDEKTVATIDDDNDPMRGMFNKGELKQLFRDANIEYPFFD